jgi:hypothetical protein
MRAISLDRKDYITLQDHRKTWRRRDGGSIPR